MSITCESTEDGALPFSHPEKQILKTVLSTSVERCIIRILNSIWDISNQVGGVKNEFSNI